MPVIVMHTLFTHNVQNINKLCIPFYGYLSIESAK